MARIFAFAAALLLAGCTSTSLPLAPKPVTGGVLSGTLIGDPGTFNPALARRGSALEVSRLMFAGLLMPDKAGGFSPDLAADFQQAEDGRRYRVRLKPALVWSDGQPLGANDVVFSFERVYGDGRSPGSLPRGLKVSAPDERTVEFVLPAPDFDFAAYLTLPILPAHALAEGDPLARWGLDADPTTLPVSGPFLCRGYTPGESLELAANPRYWRRPEQPYLAGIRYRIVPDRPAALARFQSGQSDTYRLSPEEYAALAAGRSSGDYALVSGGTEAPIYLAFNLNRKAVESPAGEWFANPAFRQGVALAIDRNQLVEQAFLNTAEAGKGTFDQSTARERLAAAGFKGGADGALTDAAGNKVRFEVLLDGDDPAQMRLGEGVRAQLALVGLDAQPRPLPRLVLRNRILRQKRWQAAITNPERLGAQPPASLSFWRSASPWHFFDLGDDRGLPPWQAQFDTTFESKAGASEREQLFAAHQPLVELVRPLAIAAIRADVRESRFSAFESTYNGRILANIWEVQKAPPPPAEVSPAPGS
ncbi:ABC transporter substrate-binding protein [Gloeobacter morelensis]|uniref:ABC transporter substrate-binding protein n=1 Tax=Gloeobacter morelensis MG652769 TaxID=2781736 RepID=A0ABY3PSB8_9CYAN|nr:ABC transporter substrate-binding protein [Gloeobacter morelensis]UFP96367.1 ABC transporter substrate-binding protein [Gloeobacter morelensis MG652769]